EVTLAPVVVANVVLRRAAPVADLGYNAYYCGSRYWADFVVADWVRSVRHQPERATVVTFLGANAAPPEAMPAERYKRLTTPFVDYERSLRDDMGRVLGPRGFEFDRDGGAVHLYRWGHGMIYPKVGWMFSAPLERNGGFVRADCARRRAKAPLGRLSFGAQDLEGNPSLECAIAAGSRRSDEALHWL